MIEIGINGKKSRENVFFLKYKYLCIYIYIYISEIFAFCDCYLELEHF